MTSVVHMEVLQYPKPESNKWLVQWEEGNGSGKEGKEERKKKNEK